MILTNLKIEGDEELARQNAGVPAKLVNPIWMQHIVGTVKLR